MAWSALLRRARLAFRRPLHMTEPPVAVRSPLAGQVAEPAVAVRAPVAGHIAETPAAGAPASRWASLRRRALRIWRGPARVAAAGNEVPPVFARVAARRSIRARPRSIRFVQVPARKVDEMLREIKKTQSMIKVAQFDKTFVKWLLEASGSAIVCSELFKGLIKKILAHLKGEEPSEDQQFEEQDAVVDTMFEVVHPW